MARVYNHLLRFVERDLGRVIEAGERVCSSLRGGRAAAGGEKGLSGGGKELARVVGGKSGEVGEKAGEEKEGGEGFEFMANVVWVEFGRAIMDDMGSIVFAAGRDEFRKVRNSWLQRIRLLTFNIPS